MPEKTLISARIFIDGHEHTRRPKVKEKVTAAAAGPKVRARRRGKFVVTLFAGLMMSSLPALAESRSVGLIEIASEFGAGTRGSSLGPDGFRTACITRGYPWCPRLYEDYERVNANKLELFSTPHRFAKHIDSIVRVNVEVGQKVSKTLAKGRLPLIIHGDHSNSIGTFSAVNRELARSQKDMCLIYMDAHGDINSPYVTDPSSGNVHGMPVLAALKLQHTPRFRVNPVSNAEKTGWEQLQRFIGKPLDKTRLVLVGQRDLDPPELDIIAREGIHWVKVSDAVPNPGKAAQDILARLRARGCKSKSTVVSVDIDVLDASLVPGTGTPSKNGFKLAELQAMLQVFARSSELIALELSEISPPLDDKNITSEAGVDLINTVMTALQAKQ